MMNEHQPNAETPEQRAWREARDRALDRYIQDALASRAAWAARDARRPWWERRRVPWARALARAASAIRGWLREAAEGMGPIQ